MQNTINISFNEALTRIGNTKPKLLQQDNTIPRPFIKWAGGKRSIVNILLENLPDSFNAYYEPFVGGGALFFALKPKQAVLSDVNLDLVITYNVVKKNPEQLIKQLKVHESKHNETYYYKIRDQQNLSDPIQVAARFIYLNKTCFNGLYRVNSKGEFNVPIGNYKNPLIADEANILECSKLLKNVDIKCHTFSKIKPNKDDFVYIDHPYHPIDSTSFTKYTKDDFTEANQIELHNYCTQLDSKGVKFMLSNSDTNFIKNLYRGYTIMLINPPRMINCKASSRKDAQEVLIRNY